MIDTTKVPWPILRDVAQNLGWEPDRGETMPPQEYLDKIAQMSPETIVERLSVWRLGDSSWGRMFIEAIDSVRGAADD